ncbi:MAG: trehalose-phosphatase [Ignavibacteria bacterium]|nr:trehalose-phosphatase [Ignavibacteria bacterium]
MKPRPLFNKRQTLTKPVMSRLGRCKNIILFLDFDGTLVPIGKTPSLATLSSETRALLRRLSNRPNIIVGLVTGRSQSDIKAKVRLRDLFLIANHGFEISMRRSHWVHRTAKEARPVLGEIVRKLKRGLSAVQGVLIENKRYTLTVHYRNVRKQSVPLVKEITRRLLRPYEGDLRITRGKKIFEVRPDAPWNKGHAVEHVLKCLRPDKTSLVVYIGDDRSDEDAFLLLRGKAITIVVGGRRRSAAKYQVSSPRTVAEFLKIIEATTTKGEG